MTLQQRLTQLKEQRSALVAKITNAATAVELDTIELDLRKVEMQIADVNAQIAAEGDQGEDPAARSNDDGMQPEQRNLNPLGTYGVANIQNRSQDTEDMYGTMEYRMAFRNYMVNGTPIPDKFRTEQRSDAMTVVGDVAAVIPTTIQQRVIEDLTTEGKILARITQTSLQGGIDIPISDIAPTATWLESELVVSDEQKAEMKAKLQFAYHVLEAKVAIGLLTATVSLPIFEATVVKALKKAMIRALETAMVSGDGSGKPKGFMNYTLPAAQVIEFNSTNIGTVKGWARMEAAVQEAYEDNDIYIMNKATWEMYLNGMTDTTGQRIGLGKINEKGQKILNGREVLTTDQIKSYDACTVGENFAALVNLDEYLLNSNLAMYYKKYFDEDKNKYIHKALMIADGKMRIGSIVSGETTKLVGAKGLIYAKKAAEPVGE